MMTTAIKLSIDNIHSIERFELDRTCKSLGIVINAEPDNAKWLCYDYRNPKFCKYVTYALQPSCKEVATMHEFIVKLNLLYIRQHKVTKALATVQSNLIACSYDFGAMRKVKRICCNIDMRPADIRKQYSDNSTKPVSVCVRAIIDNM